MTNTPARSHRAFVRGCRVALIATLMFGLAAVRAAGARAATGQAPASITAGAATGQPPASITAATTGLPDASKVIPLDACAPANSLRATCLAKVLGVRGTRSLVHPRLRKPSSPNRLRPRMARRPRRGAAPTVAAADAPQPGTPAYLQQAYDLAYLSQTAGDGVTVAVVDAYDDPAAEDDLTRYRHEFSLPACTSGSGCFTKVDQTGGTDYPNPDPQWRREISLDLDAVSALCPNCHIALVEANSNRPSDLAAAQSEAAKLGASVISDSWTVEETSSFWALEFTGSPYTFSGATTVAASGDAGYVGSGANDYPAALSQVVAAGGTSLIPASTSGSDSIRGWDEIAWSGAGSGCASWWESKPAWQTDKGCSGRSYADLSADADPRTGMQVYDSADGDWLVVGGTSEAAPLIAAYYALVGSAGQGPEWAYANASALNDPSSGFNDLGLNTPTCSPEMSYICDAGPGYDGPTGVGSISGAVAQGAPGIAGPGSDDSYTEEVSSDSAQLQGGVYPNRADTTYWWEYGPTTAYGRQTPAVDIGDGASPEPVTGSLTGLASNSTYHYRLVAQNSFGTEYGYDFTFTTAVVAQIQSPGTPTGPSPPTPPAAPPSTGTGSQTTGTGSQAPGTSAGASTPAPAPPGLSALRMGSIGATTATVRATVAARGAATTYSLRYGATRALGRRVSGSLAASGSPRAANLTWTLRNLAPGRVYYLRLAAADAGGSSATGVIQFRTSPVTITLASIRGGALKVVLRCHGSSRCRVRLQVRQGKRLIAAGRATVRGNRTASVTLHVSRAFPTLATQRTAAKLSVLSVWNRQQAVVTATIRS